ncbi:dioxygenase [Comamonas serinivorans]|uniref:Dioxygenase n=1 Tax=Comamonas serinivorans TaxID=1082851 RepID=A0A1Y0EQL0_9BURK|nr:class III extradiol ring-cleavage dioxygenase [Comamonas serinivorans]ARU05691.1 dioxygenase [Comamonas serinivorans]
MSTPESSAAPGSRLPVYYISHGGGPWPWMPERDTAYRELAASLARMPAEVGRDPRAILMVSAHWEAPEFTVQRAARPGMVYDYGGFPAYTYAVQYPSAGDPALADRVSVLLRAAGLAVAQDDERGYDHGMFSPMQAMYPDARVPVVQLSLKRGLDPQAHLVLGQALAPLRDEDVLIVGSGLSYHNLRAFGPPGHAASQAFDAWLSEAVQQPQAERDARLRAWTDAPAARLAHPREEHLLPLMVAAGAAGADVGRHSYHQRDFMGGLTVSSYRFG